MKKNKDDLLILTFGLTPSVSEEILKFLINQKSVIKLIAISELKDLYRWQGKKIDAVFLYFNRHSKKALEEIRKTRILLTDKSIVLITSKVEFQGVVNAFRSGIFDHLTLPIESSEIQTVIHRLRMHRAIQHLGKTPESAVLDLFSRPESFFSVYDISSNLERYLMLFFRPIKELEISTLDDIFSAIQRELSEKQKNLIGKFLKDDAGIIFGVEFLKAKISFLIRREEGKVFFVESINVSRFQNEDILTNPLANILKTTVRLLMDARKIEAIRMLSLTDEVTGLFNQRKLEEDLNYYIERFSYRPIGFCLLFIDIDYFKNVNDQYGHIYGGQLLRDMSDVLKNQLRSTDLVYRYGGDEFIVLLPETFLEEAKKVALRVSEAIKASNFSIAENSNYHLSLSIGVAQFPEDARSAKAIIDFADKMMYQSKKSGRGKVFHVGEVF